MIFAIPTTSDTQIVSLPMRHRVLSEDVPIDPRIVHTAGGVDGEILVLIDTDALSELVM